MVEGYGINGEILLILGIPIYLIVITILIFKKKKNGKEIIIKKELLKFIFFVYIMMLAGVTLLPIDIYFVRQPVYANRIAINYIPFVSIARDIAVVGHEDFSPAFRIKLLIRNVGGNFILLMPLGFLLPLMVKRVNSIKKVMIFSFAVSLLIETLQFLESYFKIAISRIADVDDLILNTLGAVVGYIIYVLLNLAVLKYKNKSAKYEKNIK